ncbi:MAG TPA: tetratricopeptide repeat protein [Pyrinomonadaceae bacterium]|nr:tetratricopeptide repeat protein [Pyrinomonadaceae bacterium]
MQKAVVFGVIGLIVGLAVGFFGANTINRNAAKSTAVMPGNISVPVGGAVPNAPATQGGMQPVVAEALDKAKNEPDDFDAQMSAGDMYAKIGGLEKAKEYYDKGATLVPNDFDGNVRIAAAYFDIKQYETAGKYYQKALELNPKDVNARTDLGSTYIEGPNHDIDKGIAEYEQSLQIDPKHEPTLYMLGIAYIRKGDIDGAKKTLTQLESANSASPLVAKLKEGIEKK